MIFVYVVGNATPVKKPKIEAENAQNNTFVMHLFIEKNIVSVWQRSIVLDVRKSVFRSLVLSVKKCQRSITQKVSLYPVKFIFTKFI